MKLVSIQIVFALCAIGCIDVVHSLTCYSCESILSANCKDPFTGTSVSTCTGQQCYKSGSTVGSVTSISRSCGVRISTQDKCETTSVAGVTATVCYCNSDLCNSAHNSRRASPVLPLAVALLTVMLIAITRHQWCQINMLTKENIINNNNYNYNWSSLLYHWTVKNFSEKKPIFLMKSTHNRRLKYILINSKFLLILIISYSLIINSD